MTEDLPVTPVPAPVDEARRLLEAVLRSGPGDDPGTALRWLDLSAAYHRLTAVHPPYPPILARPPDARPEAPPVGTDARPEVRPDDAAPARVLTLLAAAAASTSSDADLHRFFTVAVLVRRAMDGGVS